MAPALSVVRPASALILAIIAACGAGDGLGPAPAEIRIESSRIVTDTVRSTFEETVRVLVLGPGGRPRPGVLVQFFVAEVADPRHPCCNEPAASLMQDGSGTGLLFRETGPAGRAAAILRNGAVAGTFWLTIVVRELGIRDSIKLIIEPGNTTGIEFSPRDTAVSVGKSYALAARGMDQFGNTVHEPVVVTARNPATAELGPDGTVRGRAHGRAYFVGAVDNLRDSAVASVVPEGRLLAYTPSPAFGELAAYFAFALDGSGYSRIVPQGILGEAAAFFFPSGDQVVLQGTSSLFVSDLKSPARVLVASSAEIQQAMHPQPSRDGQWVYFTAVRGYLTSEIWRVRADGTIPGRVGPPAVFEHSMHNPTPSPDGRRLAFVDGGRSLTTAIAILDLETATVTRLPFAGTRLRWSPTAEEVAYFDGDAIHVVRPGDGVHLGSVAGLHFNKSRGQVDWSPDGAWLVACATPGSFVSGTVIVLVRRSDFLVLPLAFTATHHLCDATWQPA